MTAFSVGSFLSNQFVAIQAFQSAGFDLQSLQSQMATGLRVATPVDDGAAFAIAAGVRSDLGGMLAVQQGLGLARGTVTVALQGATSISNELTNLTKIAVAASSPANTADQLKTYAVQFDAGVAQIASMVESSTFNGINLLGQNAQSVQVTSGTSGQTLTLPGIDFITKVVDVLAANSISVAIGGGASSGTTGNTLAQSETSLTNAITSTFPGVNASDTQTFVSALETSLNQSSTGTAAFLDQLTTALNGNSFQDRLVQFTVGITLAVISFGGTPTGLINAVIAQVNLLPGASGGGGGSGGGSGSGGSGSSSSSGSVTLTDVLNTVNSVQSFVTSSLAQLGDASNSVDAAQQFLSQQSDAVTTGLGSLVDANLAKDSARLTATRVASQLALSSLSVTAQRARGVLLSLFKDALPLSSPTASPLPTGTAVATSVASG